MKKTLALILTLVMVAALCTTAFAAGSKTDAVEVTGAEDVTVGATSVAMITEEIAAAASEGELEAKDAKVLWQGDVEATVPAEGIDLTFTVDGTDGMTLYVFHYEDSAWVLVGSGKGPSVTAHFASLSPVAIVAEKTTTTAPGTAPATGVAFGITVACGVLAAAGTSAFAIAKKKD